ncbi:MAG: AAA family ATPase [Rhizobacter sp.]|nr:AAA family ATPase [Rhizobacter sp.]
MQLRLASSPHVLLPEGGTVALAPRDAVLLAWLALEGATPRARLAALLWPESEVEAARNALRQRLFQLKKIFGRELVAGQATLLLAEGVAHDLHDADSVLGDDPLGVEGELAAWLQQQRERRRQRLRASLVELADMAERARDHADALSHARELLALEPLSEEAHRRVMRLHYLAGDRAAALLAFDRCERMLKDEVGTTPSRETLALLATLEQAAVAPPPGATTALPAGVSRPPRLIGRDHELAELAQGWSTGQVVAVCGEAGLGKSRLLQAFAEPRPGVVHVAARPGDAGVPFATLVRLLRTVIAQAPEPSQGLAPGVRGEVARVLPEFGAGAPRVAGEGERLVMQRAVRALLRSRGDLSGLLVDDLHFADEASLDMLLALIDDEPGHGDAADATTLHWALAYRPAEAGSPLQAMHDALVEQVRLRPLLLRPLDDAALAELVDSLGLPGLDGRTLAPGLRQRTGGNPLFVLETLKQAWVEQRLGALADAASLPRPASVGRLIERRIAQLSPGALALARVASIAEADFEIALAEQVLGVSAMQFADALNELEAAQVLHGNAFAHDLVFEAVRASVPATIARHAHGKVAAFLEVQGGPAARIADHWQAAGQPQRALPWLDQAADAAWRAVRRKEQSGFLLRKVDILQALGRRDEAFQAGLALLDSTMGVDIDAALCTTILDRLDALATTPAQRVEAMVQRSCLAHLRGEMDAAEAGVKEALREAVRIGDARLMVIARQQLAAVLTFTNRTLESLPHSEACIAWVDEHGSLSEQTSFHTTLALAYSYAGRVQDALLHHERAIAAARADDNPANLASTLVNRGWCRIDMGDIDGARQSFLDSLRAAGLQDEHRSQNGPSAIGVALCSYTLGAYGEALSWCERAEAAYRAQQPAYLPAVWSHEAMCWHQLGQVARCTQRLAGIALDDTGVILSARVRRWLLESRLARDAGRDAAAPLHEALAHLPAGDRPDMRLPVLVEQALDLPLDDALRQLAEVREHAQRVGYGGILMGAHLMAARLATPHDSALAAHHVREALALAERHAFSLAYRAGLWLHGARALQADAPDEAARVLREGVQWVQRCAAEQVPEAFRDSFLHRNADNRELLALWARQ